MRTKYILFILLFAVCANAQVKLSTTQIPVLGTSQLSNTAVRTLQQQPAAYGVYYPTITTAGLSNTTGLVNSGSGGVVASVAGTAGSGTFNLSRPIDPTKPFRFAIKVDIEDSQPITLQITDAASDFFAGGRITTLSTGGMSGDLGGSTWATLYGSTGGIPVGTMGWWCFVGDGTQVTLSWIPDNPTGFNFDLVPGANIAYINTAFSTTTPITTLSSGKPIFGGSGTNSQYRLSQIKISNKSTTSRIISVYEAQSLAGPADGKALPPGILRTTIYQDNSAWFVLPGQLGSSAVDIMNMPHPNGSNAFSNLINTSFTQNQTALQLAKLYTAGYLLCGIEGTTPSTGTSNATSSNWGAQTGLRYRTAQLEYIKANIPGTRYINFFAQSMGDLNGLVIASTNLGYVNAVADISGVKSPTDSYTNGGFASIISKAYGTFYLNVSAATGINPSQTVVASATAAISATSISVSALSAALPSGTIITLQSGTGQSIVTLSASASSGATSITVTALTVAVNAGATYNMSNYWQPLTYNYGAMDDAYYQPPYTISDAYVAATAYVVNNIVAVTPVVSATNIAFNDPVLNAANYTKIPTYSIHGSSDPTVPFSQTVNFVTNVIAAGGLAADHQGFVPKITVASAASGATTLNIVVTGFTPNMVIPSGTTLTLSTGTGPATIVTGSVITASSTTVTVTATGSAITAGVYGSVHLAPELYTAVPDIITWFNNYKQ